MLIILECRHRQLHMRAFLTERNRGQSRFRWIHDGPSFTSRIRNQEGKTSRPQMWEKTRRQRILFCWLIEEEMQKEKIQWIHDRFLRDHEFRVRMIVHNQDEEVIDDVMFLQMKITLIICQKKNTSTTRTNGDSIPTSRVLTLYHWEIVLISNKRCLLGTFTPRSWRRTIRAFSFLQAQTMAVGTDYMMELTRFLVIFFKFRKSRKRQAKLWEWTEKPLLIALWRKPPKMTVQNSIYFVTDGSFTADDGLL